MRDLSHFFRCVFTGLIWALSSVDSQAADWQAVASLNTERSQFAAGIVDGTIVVFGGVDQDGHYLASTERLDLANPLVWRQSANNSDAISQLTASSVAGQFYAFGGLPANQQIMDRVSRYDSVGDQWRGLPNMPTARVLATAVAEDNEILLLGGHANKEGKRYYLNAIEAYNPVTDVWRNAGKMPLALESMAAANIDGKIYLFGGLQSGKKLGSAVMRFDPVSKKWQRNGFSPVPYPRLFVTGQAAPVLNGKVYLIGGGSVASVNAPVSPSDKVSIYDPVSNTWQTGPALPQPLMDHATVANDEAVYVIGGRSGDNLSSDNRVWRLSDSWKSRLSSQEICDLDADGKFSSRDAQLFSQACRNNLAYWPCDLNTDTVFNGKDIAAYKAQWKTAKAACPVIDAVSGKLNLSVDRLDFGDVSVGQSTHASVTLTNSGNAVIQINPFSPLSSGFNLSHNCGSSLEVASSCTLDFSFSPVAIGKSSEVFSIVSSASASPQTIALQGVGIETAPVSGKLALSPTSLNFGNVMEGKSALAAVTLTNSGNAAIQINAFSTLTSGFNLSHNCGSSLDVAAHCTLSFSFSPAAIGKSSDLCSIDSSAAGSPHTIALQGTGIARDDVSIIANAFANQLSDIQVQSAGIVTRILSDDVVGDRHQRFILRLSNGQTVLIAHNIDIAPRASLKVGDSVAFYGEYVWNSEGGLVHWTHHDPAGIHVAGWLKHNAAVYQ